MGKLILSLVVLIGGIFAGVSLADSYNVSSDAMAPTLRVGDKVAFVEEESYERGDIVVFTDNGAGSDRVLRVIGVGGDTIEGRNAQLLVNGEIVVEPYRSGNAYDDFGPFSVSQGEYFLLGDWRNRTRDSREFGPAPAEVIKGKVIVRTLPLPRFGGV